MKTSLRNSMVSFVLSFVCTMCAAIPAHNEIWTRFYLSHELTKKFRVEGEYQFRLQDTPGSNGFPAHRLQQGVRIWTFCKLNPALTVGLSPFSMFRSYPLINTQADFSAGNSTELRFAGNGEWKADALLSEFKFRMGYESRHSNKDGTENWTRKDRLRIRALLTIPFANLDSSLSGLSVYFGDEYFFQGQEVFTKNVQFDQNRIIAGIAFKACAYLKLDLVYVHILRNSASGDYFERAAWISTTINL